MFDTTTYKTESKVVAVTKEIEKTITPDKVTEMYDTVKEEVEKNILQKLRIESNEVKGIVTIAKDVFSCSLVISTHFNLNGKDYFDKTLMNEFDFNKFSPRDAIQKLIKHYTEVVSEELTKTVINALDIK